MSSFPSGIIDSGACASVADNETLHMAMEKLEIVKVEDSTVWLQNHLFENYREDQTTLHAVKMPLCSMEPNSHVNVECDVAFDAINGDLLVFSEFFLSSPSELQSMTNTRRLHFL